ncbi:RING finger protein 141 isoform X2 [Rhipicephalus microplus]|uniref:RING finger protein 141 isoform X2 n=1 Tax=Rhipicephalus microplus TaxID=6941 RepID=UPI003F6A5B5B
MGSHLSSEVMGAFRQSQVFGEITTITFERLMAKVKELNDICQCLTDTKNRHLVFEVCGTSETPVLWKSEVRILCSKVGAGDRQARLLTLRQFLHTYHTIKAYYSAAASSGAAKMCTSTLFSGVLGTELEECCICMEHKPEVTLPCTHSYCLRCIEQCFQGTTDINVRLDASSLNLPQVSGEAHGPKSWQKNWTKERPFIFKLPTSNRKKLNTCDSDNTMCHQYTRNVSNTTCPLCREEFESTNETWVISEAPESSEVLSEMQKALSKLPEQESSIPL